MPLGYVKVARWDGVSKLAFDDAEWDESKVKRDEGGKFTSGGGGGGGAKAEAPKTETEKPEPSKKQHPKMADVAYPINPIKSALTQAGFVKGKGKQNYMFTHPESGEQIEIHAANEGQKWLTGWTHGEHTGKGPTSLAKYLADLAGKPKSTAEVKQELAAQGYGETTAKPPEPPPVPKEPASASSGGHWDIPWPGEEPKKEAPKEPEKNYPKGIQPAFHNALEYNGFSYTNSEWDGKIYKKPADGVVVKVYEVAKPKETSPADINWTVSTTKGFEKDEATLHGTGMAGMLNGIIKAKDKHQAEIGTPAAAKEIGVPPDLAHLWPHKTESAGWEYYHDDPDNETQEVAIGQNGDWQIWKKGEGSTSGNGQAMLNAALQSYLGAESKPPAPEPKTGMTSSVQKLLPHAEKITDYTTIYADKNINSGEQTEEVTLNDAGYWSIWQKDKGIVAEGDGVQALNDAFEKLHPRDEHGHFIGKGGEAETAAEPVPLTDQEEKDKHPSLGVHDWLNKQGFKPTGVGGGNNPNHYYQNDKGAMIGISAQEVGGDYEWVYSNANGEGEKGSGIDLLAQALTSTGPIVGSSPEAQKQKIADLQGQLTNVMNASLSGKGFEVVGASEDSLLYKHPDSGTSLKVTPAEGGAQWTLYDASGKDVGSGKGAGNLTEAYYKHKHAAAEAPPPPIVHPNQAMHDWLKVSGFNPESETDDYVRYVNAAGDAARFFKTPTAAGYEWGYFPKSGKWKTGTGLADFNVALAQQANQSPGPTTTMAAGQSVAQAPIPVNKQKNWSVDFKLPKKHWAYKYYALGGMGFAPTKNMKSSVMYEDDNGNKVFLQKKLKKGASQLEWQLNYQKPGGGTGYEWGQGHAALKQRLNEKVAGVAPAPAAAPAASGGSLKAMAGSLLNKVGYESAAFMNGKSVAAWAYSLPNDKKLYVDTNSSQWMILQGTQTLDSGAGADTLKAALQDHGVSLSGAAAAAPEPPPPAAPTVPKVTPPDDFESVLAHKTDAGAGIDAYTDTADPLDATEQVTFNQDGSWTIWQKGGDVFVGQGQASFNQQFEALHPRGPDGKFAKKAGGEELAPKIKLSTEVSEWSAGSALPKDLNGVEFKKFTPPANWQDVAGQNPSVKEPTMMPTSKKISAGVLIEEPDGRVWLAKPSGGYGGYDYTFPKGGQEPGHSLQVTAIKEAYEESGLKVDITGFAGDYEGDASLTRYYFAKRTGGDPTAFDQAETAGMVLVPKDQLHNYLNKLRDKNIATNHLSPDPNAPKKTPVMAGVSAATGLNTAQMKKVGGQLGSNPGGQFEDADGTKYYVKTPKTADHAQNELLAAALYKLVGGAGSTLDYQSAINDGKLSVATKWEKKDKDNIGQLSPAEKKAAQRDFAIQAWIANWDAAGIDNSNIGVVNGKVIPLDLGGALKFRAQGQPKTLHPEAPEWESLRDGTNVNTTQLYGSMTTAELQQSAQRLKAVTDNMIRQAVMANPPADSMMRDALISTLIKRRDAILKKATPDQYGKLHSSNSSWDAKYRERLAKAPIPTKKEGAAVTKYSGGSYDPWNEALRKSYGKESGGYDTASLKQYLAKANWDEDGAIVKRRISSDFAEWLIDEASEDVHYFQDHGFSSSDHWSGKLTLRIKLPKGAQAVAIGEYSSHPGENEILIQAGSKYRIDHFDPNSMTMDVTLVRSGDAKTGVWHEKIKGAAGK